MRQAHQRPFAANLLHYFFQAEDGIRDLTVTGVQTCALPIWSVRQNHSTRYCVNWNPIKAEKTRSRISSIPSPSNCNTVSARHSTTITKIKLSGVFTLSRQQPICLLA